MENISVVQKNLLERKIKEYFTNNPTKKAAIFETNVGGRVFWKVVKNKSGYDITEVKTSKSSFQLKEAAPLPGDEKYKKEPTPGSADKTNPRGAAPIPYSPGKLQTPAPGQPPKAMGPTGTNILPGNPKGVAPTPQPYGSGGALSAATKSMPTAGRKPEPMDDVPSAQPLSAKTQKKIDKYQAGTQKALSWNPGSMDGEFSKHLQKTKDVAGTINKMPPGEFKRVFGWTGAQNAAALTGNKDMFNKAMDFVSQHNPLVAQLTGRKQTAGTKLPPKMPLSAGAKNEGVMNEASPGFAKISAAFMMYMAKPNDHKVASDFVNTISREKVGITNSQEKQAIADIEAAHMGAATKMVNKTTAATPFGAGPKAGVVAAGKVATGRILREDDEEKPEKKKKDEPKDKTKGGGDAEISEPTALAKAEPDVKDPEGIEDAPAEPEAPVAPPEAPAEPKKSPEETVVSDRLAGQTIKNAAVSLKPHGGSISLELVGVKIPVTLSWDSAGKVIFSFKNRPYILRHG